MKKTLTGFLIVLLTVGSIAFMGQSSNTPPLVRNIILDEAVTVTNDTFFSEWVNIERFSDVEIFVTVGDSVSFAGGFNVQYKAGGTYFGTATPYSAAADTGSLANLTDTPKGSGKVLRSGSVASIIPGATQMRIFAFRRDYSTGVTSSLRVTLSGR